MSFRMKLFYALIKLMGVKKKMVNSDEGMGENKEKILASQKLKLKLNILSDFSVKEEEIAGRKVFRFKRDDGKKEQVLIHLFGGGFINYATNFDLKFIKAMLKELDIEIVLPIYPLAPNYKLSEIIEYTNTVYEELLKEYEPNQISILGFSAGASLAVYLFNYRRLKNMEEIFPRQLILSSPLGEYPLRPQTIEKMKTIEDKDAFFIVPFIEELCKFVSEPEYPGLVSANTHDMTGFPPIKLMYGGREIFSAFVDGYKEAEKKYNLDIEYIIGKDSPHCWPLILFTPEGKKAFKQIVEFMRK